jgi:competence protein ComEC
VLSISGYHMAVVAGVVFFVLRALFALMPAFSNRHPIKKWDNGFRRPAFRCRTSLRGRETTVASLFLASLLFPVVSGRISVIAY